MPCRPVASQDDHASTKLPPKSSRPHRNARAVGQGRFARRRRNQHPCVRPAASPGSCGVRRTCSRGQRALSMPRCRVPTLIGSEARWRHRRKSGVRFATSRCASLVPDAGTTGLKPFPGPSACPLERRAETRLMADCAVACGELTLGSPQLLRLGVFIHAGYLVRTVLKLWPVGEFGWPRASVTDPAGRRDRLRAGARASNWAHSFGQLGAQIADGNVLIEPGRP